MKVSVIWLGIFLIGILFIGVLWKGKGVYEAFTTEESEHTEEGFAGSLDDLQVSSCPANSKQFIDNNGIVICCDGTVSDGKCQGKTICSLSEGSAQYPTCSTWMAAYLNEKGRNRCPPSMPNYYESRDGKVKGCTAGRRNKDGSGPITQNEKFCKLYNDQRSEEGKIDSCENQKLLERTVCFKSSDIRVEKTLIPVLEGAFPAQVQCNFGDVNSRTAGTCITNDSMDRFMFRLFEIFGIKGYDSWKANTVKMDPIDKINYCSVTEKYKIRKSITFKDLPTVKVFD